MNLTKAPSFKTFEELVKGNPDEKLYRVSPSLVKFISQRTWALARAKDIKIEPRIGARPGRPEKYDDAERNLIRDSKRSAKELSEKYDIPLRTVYFIRAGR